MSNLKNPAVPGLVTLGFFALWSVFWFVMAGRIEGEVERWVDRQAQHGTEVSYGALDVSGFPFRLVASFDAPRIIAQDDPRAFAWQGDGLRLITQVWDMQRIIIELIGPQNVSWLDTPEAGAPDQMMIDFTGTKLRGSLGLSDGRIESINTDFTEVTAQLFGEGAFALIGDLPRHLTLDALEYHSRVVESDEKVTRRDVMVQATGISEANAPSSGETADAIEEILVAFSEELGAQSPLHSGDIGTGAPRIPVQELDIHTAQILWPPVSARLNGHLTRTAGEDFDGKVTLYLKGHEDLVRAMATRGDIPEAAAVVAGALFGVISLITQTNEAGELVVPLDVRDGDVSFGFLPLFGKEDYR